MDFGIAGVAAITVIAYIVGWPRASARWTTNGSRSCAARPARRSVSRGCMVMPDFPAGDAISAAAVGIVSGLAATGAHQAVRQMTCHENGTCGK